MGKAAASGGAGERPGVPAETNCPYAPTPSPPSCTPPRRNLGMRNAACGVPQPCWSRRGAGSRKPPNACGGEACQQSRSPFRRPCLQGTLGRRGGSDSRSYTRALQRVFCLVVVVGGVTRDAHRRATPQLGIWGMFPAVFWDHEVIEQAKHLLQPSEPSWGPPTSKGVGVKLA